MFQSFSKSIFLAAMGALFCARAFAADFAALEEHGKVLYYNITDADAQTVEVVNSPNNDYGGDYTIPSTVTYHGLTYNVTAIGKKAFPNLSGARFTISEGIKTIKEEAFSNGANNVFRLPSSLVTLEYSALGWHASAIYCPSLEVWLSLDTSLKCANLYINDELLTELIVPEGTESLGAFKFNGNESLKYVSFPSGLKTIYTGCFNNTHIKSFSVNTIEDWLNIKSITPLLAPGTLLYVGGEPLTELTIPQYVTSFQASSFSNYSFLTFINVASIEQWLSLDLDAPLLNEKRRLFIDGELLTELTIPEGFTKIRASEFSNYSYLTRVNAASIEQWLSLDLDAPLLNENRRLYIGGELLTFVEMPPATDIKPYAFAGCSTLTGIRLNNGGIKSIGDYAFKNCTSLENALFGLPSLLHLGKGVLEGCVGLKFVSLGDNISLGTSEGKYTVPWGTVFPLYEYVPDPSKFYYFFGETIFPLLEKMVVCPDTYMETRFPLSQFPNLKELDVASITPPEVYYGSLRYDGHFGPDYYAWDEYTYTNSPSINFDGFDPSNVELYVPEGTAEAYRSKAPWSKFKRINEVRYICNDVAVGQQTVTCNPHEQVTLPVYYTPRASIAVKEISYDADKITLISINPLVVEAGEPTTTDISVTATNGKTVTVTLVVKPYSVTCGQTDYDLKVNSQFTHSVSTNGDVNLLTLEISNPEVVELISESIIGSTKKYSLISKSAGEATLTSTLPNGDVATANVVVRPPLESLKISMQELEMKAGEEYQLNYQVWPENAYYDSIIWRTTNSDICTVDNYGTVTARGVGDAFVTCTSADNPNITSACLVTVVPTPVESIKFSWGEYNDYRNELYGNPADGKVWLPAETVEFFLCVDIYPTNATNRSIEIYMPDTSIVFPEQNPWISDGRYSSEAIMMFTNVDKMFGEAEVIARALDGSGVEQRLIINYGIGSVEDGIDTVDTGIGPDAAPEYFNLHGVKVNNPVAGLYLVRRGNTVTKELVR